MPPNFSLLQAAPPPTARCGGILSGRCGLSRQDECHSRPRPSGLGSFLAGHQTTWATVGKLVMSGPQGGRFVSIDDSRVVALSRLPTIRHRLAGSASHRVGADRGRLAGENFWRWVVGADKPDANIVLQDLASHRNRCIHFSGNLHGDSGHVGS